MSKMSAQLVKVFVYGTLKRGEPNHFWLTKAENGFARFLAEGRTKERFPLVVGTRYNIPFLLDKPGTGQSVCGEVYEVDEAMFAQLDVLEDYPKYYDREVRTVLTKENEALDCWLYLIRNYPKQLLEKPHLESYRNSPEKPYCERSKRDDNVKSIDDMAY